MCMNGGWERMSENIASMKQTRREHCKVIYIGPGTGQTGSCRQNCMSISPWILNVMCLMIPEQLVACVHNHR